ncbi:MAG TPA: hypothetical protein VIT68_02980, partial [Candidatus Gracilibacteria bacterium]
MLSLDLTYADNMQLDQSQLQDFLGRIQDRHQGFYTCIDDTLVLDQIEAYAKAVEGRYDDIVILGIGGSALGPRAIRDTLRPLFHQPKPHLHVIDNVDPAMLQELEDHIDIGKTLFLVITKSGGTPETLSQYYYFRKKVEQVGLIIAEHFVFITDPEKGVLRAIAKKEPIPVFDIPSDVGGRFSVLTPVGLLPAALMGMDIRSMIEGAQEVRDRFLCGEVTDNICYELASLQYKALERGKSNTVFMPYVAHLKTVGDWYSQLLAESTGKINRRGENTGLTPLVATGTTDQHSQVQLYAQGPDDKHFIFLITKTQDHSHIIPAPEGDDKTKMLNGVSFGKLLYTEYKATAA